MIELTKEIEGLLDGFNANDRAQILRRAWAACCDGNALPCLGFDPWDGKHESDRLDIERDFVEFIINADYFST